MKSGVYTYRVIKNAFYAPKTTFVMSVILNFFVIFIG